MVGAVQRDDGQVVLGSFVSASRPDYWHEESDIICTVLQRIVVVREASHFTPVLNVTKRYVVSAILPVQVGHKAQI